MIYKSPDMEANKIKGKAQGLKVLCLSQGVLCNQDSFIFIVRGSR